MSLLAVVLFLSGMVALLVGATRAAFALRAIVRAHGGLPSLRDALPPARLADDLRLRPRAGLGRDAPHPLTASPATAARRRRSASSIAQMASGRR